MRKGRAHPISLSLLQGEFDWILEQADQKLWHCIDAVPYDSVATQGGRKHLLSFGRQPHSLFLV